MTNKLGQMQQRTFLLPLSVPDATSPVFCLLTQNQVVEILGGLPVSRIPLSPSWLAGVLPSRDELLPVIALDSLCGATQGRLGAVYRQLVVIRTGADDPQSGEPLKAVIASSGKVQMMRFSSKLLASAFAAVEAPASLQHTGLVRGFFQWRNSGFALLDLGSLVQGGTWAPNAPIEVLADRTKTRALAGTDHIPALEVGF